MTLAATSRYRLRMKSAEAWELRAALGTRQAPGDLALAEPVEERPRVGLVVGDEPVQRHRGRAHRDVGAAGGRLTPLPAPRAGFEPAAYSLGGLSGAKTHG